MPAGIESPVHRYHRHTGTCLPRRMDLQESFSPYLFHDGRVGRSSEEPTPFMVT